MSPRAVISAPRLAQAGQPPRRSGTRPVFMERNPGPARFQPALTRPESLCHGTVLGVARTTPGRVTASGGGLVVPPSAGAPSVASGGARRTIGGGRTALLDTGGACDPGVGHDPYTESG
jgi:hypothetical protein